MKKLLILITFLICTIGANSQNTFKYVVNLNGGVTVGGGEKIDSITVSNDTVYFYHGATRLYIAGTGGTGLAMVYPGAGIALSTGSAWGASITNSSANWNTAYGWGNHSGAGYYVGSTSTIRGLLSSTATGLTYTSGTGAFSLSAGYEIPTTVNTAYWATGYSERLQWDGGPSNLVAATGRTSLGGTTVGQSFYTLTNPGAITFLRMNADNTVTALSAADFRTAISAIAVADTATMLTPYIARADTASMLTPYIARGDTASMLTNYSLTSEVRQIINDSLDAAIAGAETGIALADSTGVLEGNYMTRLQTAALISDSLDLITVAADLSGDIIIGTSRANYLKIESSLYLDSLGVMGADTVALVGIVRGDSVLIEMHALVTASGGTGDVTLTQFTDSIAALRGEINDLYVILDDIYTAMGTIGVDIKAPTIDSLEIGRYASDTLIVWFSEPMNTDSLSASTVFTFKEGGTTFGIDTIYFVNDSIMDIVLDSAAIYGAVYTLDYTRAFPMLQDTAGNRLANFSNRTVTNNIIDTAPFLVSAELGTYNDTIIVALFNKALDETSIPDTLDFVFRAGTDTIGIRSIDIATDTVFIALDSLSTMYADSTLLLDYISGTNPLRSLSEVEVVNFADSTVVFNDPNAPKYEDDFQSISGDGVPLSGEGDWVIRQGSNINVYNDFRGGDYADNQVVAHATASVQSTIFYEAAIDNDQWAEVEYTTAAFGRSGAAIRLSLDGDDLVQGYAIRANSSQLLLGTIDAGVFTGLDGLYSTAVVVGDIIRIQAVGTTIKMFVNGTEELSVTDSTYSSGYAGMTFFHNSGCGVDNFKAGEIK